MKSILLLIEHQRNRNILAQWLKEEYQILLPGSQDSFVCEGEHLLSQTFDICFVDFAAVHQLRQQILARREMEVPVFLPFIFFTPLKDIGLATDSLEPLVDDIVHLPIQQIELKTKLRVLLRSRAYSLQLQATQAKLNDALAQEKQLNQLKSRFVSVVSHEFRNPLNGILGMTQILKSYSDKLSPEKKEEVLTVLQRNVTKMTQLLEDVLIISRKDMGKLQFDPAPLELEIFCRGLICEVQTAFDDKPQINFVYEGESTKFNLDSKLIRPVLTNLLSNACKYSPQATTIGFYVCCLDSEIVIKIRDRGIGIPPEDIPNLFDSFYRASNSAGYQGTGLGLAIAKDYVELHQGAIAVESELNVGTTFTVTIPQL